MKQLFLKNVFTGTCTLRGKNDVPLNFGDSNIFYINIIDVF